MLNNVQKLIRRDLVLKLSLDNFHELPTLSKASLNLSNKFISAEKSLILPYFLACSLWTGQRPQIVRAKKSVASFQLKEKALFGCKVTLRKQSLARFVSRLFFAVLPNLQKSSFLNFGFFHENKVDFGLESFLQCLEIQSTPEMFDFVKGCSVSLETTGNCTKINQVFLSGFCFPISKKNISYGKL